MGQKPDKDDRIAIALVKKMKWSLSGDPVIAATEDGQEFLRVAGQSKNYPSLGVSGTVAHAGADSFGAIAEADIYLKAFNEVVGKDFEDYWAKALGEKPRANWLDGGIISIGDIIIESLHDPKSYKFDRFRVTVGQYQGITAWKVDYWFRAKNAFGALILQNYYFYVRNGQVIAMEKPKS